MNKKTHVHLEYVPNCALRIDHRTYKIPELSSLLTWALNFLRAKVTVCNYSACVTLTPNSFNHKLGISTHMVSIILIYHQQLFNTEVSYSLSCLDN